MSTQTQTSPTGGRIEPLESAKAQAWWWRYMRISGILLIPLVFGHLAIVHLINSVAVINYEWVISTRWSFIPWRIYDAFMLWFASLHGFRGLKYVIDDYVHNTTWNRILTWVSVLLALALILIGSMAIVGTPFPE